MTEASIGEIATLLAPSQEFTDGIPQWTDIPCRAVMTGGEEQTVDDFGRLSDGGEVLLFTTGQPRPGWRLRRGDREYELRSVRVCRALDGRVRAYRCTVV